MILTSIEFKSNLESALDNCKKSVLAMSAFIKFNALNSSIFSDSLDEKEVVVIARWRKEDLLANASDLCVYELCKSKGWKFGVDFNLHGKLFLIDKKNVFLGSANITQRGLHVDLIGNNEFGTKFEATKIDLVKLDKFIESEVTWMSDELFNLISLDLDRAKINKGLTKLDGWSSEIKEIVEKDVDYLWVQELVFSTPNDLLNLNLNEFNAIHDYELLGMNLEDISVSSLKSKFKRTRLFRWLCSKLKDNNLSFGGLTAELHSAILDDPKPYRVDIKEYNKVIFSWAEFMDDTFVVSRPRYSQVLSLKGNL